MPAAALPAPLPPSTSRCLNSAFSSVHSLILIFVAVSSQFAVR